ncbi:serine/threonine/tyrosine-interacting protein [Halyomorpha halys]|uniref:serine/threonine/tyrosine-interacting protein n=1 Tax=Halyomorpha halys TaxID=286706 RepID=UPI0006D4E854|nr:serine/threonine/tyrosine-interacting protein [Halyomorpha halys]
MVYEGENDSFHNGLGTDEKNQSVFHSLQEFPSGSDEWKYSMRRCMQEIVPSLFLGPYSAAIKSKLDELKSHGITHIICVRHTLEANFIKPNFEDQFKYLVLEIADSVTENIIHLFPIVKKFVDECLASGGKVLVHGNAGISRSAALVLAYIMERYGITCKRAHEIVQHRRFCINPNEGFMAQLREFEAIYRAQRELTDVQPSSAKGRHKRTCEEIEEI